MEQLLLLGRMLQGTMKSPSHFSHHPAAAGTFFTAMLLGLKFCSCQSQKNLQNSKMGLQLLEDRVFRLVALILASFYISSVLTFYTDGQQFAKMLIGCSFSVDFSL